jgi:hypothetical protein
MAQEVQAVAPEVVARGTDGYRLVNYERLGLEAQTYGQRIASGGHVPAGVPVRH